jgi:hypothetical protein
VKILKIFLLTTIISFSLHAGIGGFCNSLFVSPITKIFSTRVKVENLTENLNIVYFNGNLHVEVGIDGELWNPVMQYRKSRTLEERIESANMGNGGFYSYQIRVTADEKEAALNFIKKNQGAFYQTCIGGACRVINRNTGFLIPTPISKLPVLTNGYLKMLKFLKHRRVESIEYYGETSLDEVFMTNAVQVIVTAWPTWLIYEFIKMF